MKKVRLAKAKTAHAKTALERQIAAHRSTGRHIDRMVYELYYLTEAEIKIVEEATAGDDFRGRFDRLGESHENSINGCRVLSLYRFAPSGARAQVGAPGSMRLMVFRRAPARVANASLIGLPAATRRAAA